MEKFYTTKEVADILKVSESKIKKHLADGSLKSFKIGEKTVRISEQQLQEFVTGGGKNAKGK